MKSAKLCYRAMNNAAENAIICAKRGNRAAVSQIFCKYCGAALREPSPETSSVTQMLGDPRSKPDSTLPDKLRVVCSLGQNQTDCVSSGETVEIPLRVLRNLGRLLQWRGYCSHDFHFGLRGGNRLSNLVTALLASSSDFSFRSTSSA